MENQTQKKFTTETYDKFSNSKEVSTLRQKKFGGWTETHEPNQSIQLYKSDFAMPSVKIDYEVRLYAKAIYMTNPDTEEFYIEFLKLNPLCCLIVFSESASSPEIEKLL